MQNQISGSPAEPEVSGKNCEQEYIPIVRSGAWVDIGFRQNMEDTYICCDNFTDEYCLQKTGDGPNAFYGVSFLSSIPCNLHYTEIILFLSSF